MGLEKKEDARMRKFLTVSLIFIFSVAPRFVWAGDDNLLVVDIPGQKKQGSGQENKILPTERPSENSAPVISGQGDEFAKDLEKIKAFQEAMNDRRRAIEMIRLDLEKENLILKEKQAQKQIYDINNSLPVVKKEELQKIALSDGLKAPLADPADVRLVMLLISGDHKEGILTIKNTAYPFKEGDCVASKLTVSKITQDTVTFKQADQTEFTLDFMD
jgi:hypothetical protein